MMTKNFVLGVGAQKAGTTWLHDYLSGRDDSNFGFTKEYHIFDAIEVPHCIHYKRKAIRKTLSLLDENETEWKPHFQIQRLAFLSDINMYFSYFTDLLHTDKINITGDISPPYSGLSQETLMMIKRNFEARGVTVKPVFLMRDPVKRLRSWVRMRFAGKKVKPTLDQEIKGMQTMQLTPNDMVLSDYKNTVQNLDKVFGDQVYYAFFEDFFQKDSIERLCDFLDIKYVKGDYSKKVNVNKTDSGADSSQSKSDISPDLLAEFAGKYDWIYDFCAKRFGREKVETLWNVPWKETSSSEEGKKNRSYSLGRLRA